MADVTVTSEAVWLRDQFLADLRAMQQELEQSTQRMSSLSVTIPLKLETSGATTQLEAFIKSAQAQGINIPINVGGGGGSAVSNYFMSSTSISNTLTNETNNLFQNVSVEINNALHQLFQQFNSQVSNTVNTVNNSGGGGGGGSVGGGRGGLRAPSGFGRYLTYGFAAREAFRAVMASREYGIDQYEAGNDQAAQAEATLKYSHQRFPLADFFEDPTGMKEAEIRSSLSDSKQDNSYGRERYSRSEEVQAATARAGLSRISGTDLARGQAAESYRTSIQAIDDKEREESAKVAGEAADRRTRAEAKFNSAGEYVSNETIDSILAGSGPAAAARTAAGRERDLTVSQAGEVARNRIAEINAASEAQRQAIEEEHKNTLRNITSDEILQNTESGARITNTGVEREAARQQLQGQPISAAKMQFAAQQEAEVDALQARIENARTKGDSTEVDRLSGEMNAKIAANPDLLAAHNQQIDVQENLRNIANEKQATDVRASAQEDVERAGGNVGGTAISRLQREDAERVDILNKQADQLDKTNKAEADRLRTLADAEKEAGTSREAALRKSQELRSQDATADIDASTRAMNLRATGRSYQAGEESANEGYNRRIAILRRDPARAAEADALERERDAASSERQAFRTEDTTRIRAGTRELSFRNQHRDAEADLQRLNEQHREEIFNAGGDPQKIDALNAEHRERLKGFLQNHVTSVTTSTNARDAYFAVQAAVLGDPTGSQQRSIVNAQAQARREIQATMQNAGAAAIGRGAAAAGAGQAAGHQQASAKGDDTHEKLDRAANHLEEVAEKLNSVFSA